MSEFNLIYEKWIPCLTKQSQEKIELGLFDVLINAQEIDEIIGENPLITVSIYRLLLAILHDCFQGPKDVEEWGNLWERGKFERNSLEKYFDDNKDNFFLFHNEKPFFQTANLSLEEKFLKPIWKFFLEGEGYATVFEHTNLQKPLKLAYHEATRFLLAFQNFDVGGLQTYIHEKGMSKEEISLVKSADAALFNKCAVGLVKGENLFKTLLLNLTQYNRNFGIPFPKKPITKDFPVWKNDEPIDPKNDKSPDGYLDLLTWQNRQIKLKKDEENKIIQQVVVMKGNQIKELSDLFGKEQMVAFEKVFKTVDEGKKKARKMVWSPISFQKEKALWRDSLSLFHSVKDKFARPELLNWLNDLVANGKLERETVFPIDFFGICVNKAKPLFWRHERLPMPLKYLSDAELCSELGEALKLAEITAIKLSQSIFRTSTLYYLPESRFEVGNWFKPFCSEEAKKAFEEYKKGKNVKEKFKREIPLLQKTLAPELRYWSRLEMPFRTHLLELVKGKSVWKNQRENWAVKVLKAVLFTAFTEATQHLGNSPNALRAISISQSWLSAEFNAKKKKFLNFEVFEDDEEKTNNDEEEETE